MFDSIDPFDGQRPVALWVEKTYENIDHRVPYYSPCTVTMAEEEAFRCGSTAFDFTCHVTSHHVMSCHVTQSRDDIC